MKLGFLFVMVALLASASQARTECDYYLEKADALGCDASNYLVRYGYRYCRKFESRHEKFSSRARPVLASLRTCLIEVMESSRPTCATSAKIGYGSHADCYVASGFCELKRSDKIDILWRIRGEFFNPRFRRAANEVLARCRDK
jgi:hypothetical protein